MSQPSTGFEDYAEGEDGTPIGEYDISVIPSDFNVMTLNGLVDRGWVRIPGFQRNFVWDLGRASRLIESLVLGLPVPQLFLYEQERHKNLLIDGQQRLMSIYYFIKQRFPRPKRRAELRSVFDRHGNIPDEVLHDDTYFQDFSLRLPESLPGQSNRLKGLKYETLGEDYRSALDLRPIRCIVVKQNLPVEGDTSMYEIFNRLNSGGVNLRPQEIRTSMYHSEFYDMLNRVNTREEWRRILQSSELDIHMKDIEVLLRGFAMLSDGNVYAPSMVKFLNQYSKKCQENDQAMNEYLEQLFGSFLDASASLPDDTFINKGNNRFNIALYEAVFAAACRVPFNGKDLLYEELDEGRIETLKTDDSFLAATQRGTTQKSNVEARLDRAEAILGYA